MKPNREEPKVLVQALAAGTVAPDFIITAIAVVTLTILLTV